jgi:hypothetical protein
MSHFTNRNWQCEEDWVEIVKNSEVSDVSSENYDSNMLSDNTNRLINSKNENHECSGDERTESGTWTEAGPHFPFIRKLDLNVKIQKIHQNCLTYLLS